MLLQGRGFTVRDCVCRLKRDSAPSENIFKAHRVAVILGGSFHYECDSGATLLGPGSMLLGRAGGGYCFRHVDDGGDRSMIYDFCDELLDELRCSLGIHHGGGVGFRGVSIPASPSTAVASALALQALELNDVELLEESALLVADAAVAGGARTNSLPMRTADRTRRRICGAEERQVARALRHIELHHQQDCSLRVLADQAGVSIYRFLRLFKNLTAQTPRQYLVAIRLRAAATRLIETTDKVLEIAYEVGFGDISHFNESFGVAFGTSPTGFRRRYGKYRVTADRTPDSPETC